MYKKIISLAPSNTEILYALEADDNLIACTRYCDFPDEAKKKPRIGGWLDINDELIRKFEPDLLLTSTFVQNKITKKYKTSKMNVVALMPTTLKGVFDSITEIGKLVDKENEALKLIQNMKNKLNEIKNQLEKSNGQKTMKNKNQIKKSKIEIKKPRVYIEECTARRLQQSKYRNMILKLL